MTILWHVYKARQAYLDVGRFRSQVNMDMRNEVVPMIVEEHMRTVASWAHKPSFVAELQNTSDGVGVYVHPDSSFMGKVWTWLSQGVAGHIILPRRRKALAFRPGYVAKTGYHYYAGPGTVSGKLTFSRGHWWPGIWPRDFPGMITMRVGDEFRRLTENILRRAVRVARRNMRGG